MSLTRKEWKCIFFNLIFFFYSIRCWIACLRMAELQIWDCFCRNFTEMIELDGISRDVWYHHQLHTKQVSCKIVMLMFFNIIFFLNITFDYIAVFKLLLGLHMYQQLQCILLDIGGHRSQVTGHRFEFHFSPFFFFSSQKLIPLLFWFNLLLVKNNYDHTFIF